MAAKGRVIGNKLIASQLRENISCWTTNIYLCKGVATSFGGRFLIMDTGRLAEKHKVCYEVLWDSANVQTSKRDVFIHASFCSYFG